MVQIDSYYGHLGRYQHFLHSSDLNYQGNSTADERRFASGTNVELLSYRRYQPL